MSKTSKTHLSVCFDLETEPMSAAFFDAQKAGHSTYRHLPKPRVGVAHILPDDEYLVFGPSDMPALWDLLLRADELVSFNGRHFDVGVVCKHTKHVKSAMAPLLSSKHVDLMRIVEAKVGFRLSLDGLAQKLLGERKHTKGRKMQELDGTKLIEACTSDVRQTRMLHALYLSGKLDSLGASDFNRRSFRLSPQEEAKAAAADAWEGVVGYKYFEPGEYEELSLHMTDFELMESCCETEGQMADWLAGWR